MGTPIPPGRWDGPASPGRMRLAGFDFDLLTEAGVVDHIVSESSSGQGGWVATPNIDICHRARRSPTCATWYGTLR